MFDGHNIEDLPDYLQGPLIEGINLDEINALEQFLETNSPRSDNKQIVEKLDSNQNITKETNDHNDIVNQTGEDAEMNPPTLNSPEAPSHDPSLDKYGLPADIHHNFSRWLYGDLSSFAPGSTKKKTADEERTPLQKIRRKRKRRRLQIQQQQAAERHQEQLRLQHQQLQQQEEQSLEYNNDTACHDLKYLTQDLELDEMQPIDELLTPLLTMHHSILDSSKKVTTDRPPAPNMVPTNANLRNQTKNYSRSTKAKLTITLKTTKTIIDRRPMFKKWKTLGKASTSNIDGTNEVSSTSLIAPGEDCDDSDDYEFEEVNGDEPGPNR